MNIVSDKTGGVIKVEDFKKAAFTGKYLEVRGLDTSLRGKTLIRKYLPPSFRSYSQ